MQKKTKIILLFAFSCFCLVFLGNFSAKAADPIRPLTLIYISPQKLTESIRREYNPTTGVPGNPIVTNEEGEYDLVPADFLDVCIGPPAWGLCRRVVSGGFGISQTNPWIWVGGRAFFVPY